MAFNKHHHQRHLKHQAQQHKHNQPTKIQTKSRKYTYGFSIVLQSCIVMLHLIISEFLYNLLKYTQRPFIKYVNLFRFHRISVLLWLHKCVKLFWQDSATREFILYLSYLHGSPVNVALKPFSLFPFKLTVWINHEGQIFYVTGSGKITD